MKTLRQSEAELQCLALQELHSIDHNAILKTMRELENTILGISPRVPFVFEFPTTINGSHLKEDYLHQLVAAMNWIYQKWKTYDENRPLRPKEVLTSRDMGEKETIWVQRNTILSRFKGFILRYDPDTANQLPTLLTPLFDNDCPYHVELVAAPQKLGPSPSDAQTQMAKAMKALLLWRP